MSTVYEMTRALRALHDAIETPFDDEGAVLDAATGELLPAAEAERILAELEGSLGDKLDRIAALRSNVSRSREAKAAEVERLRTAQERDGRTLARLDALARSALHALGARRHQGAIHTIALRRNPARVVVDDETLIPPELQRVVPERREPDRAAIAKSIRAGLPILGARLVEGDERIDVR